MLGYVVATGRGAADRLLQEVSETLRTEGVPLAGVVQVNLDRGETHKCHMDLHVLSGAEVIRISQDLGTLSSGCRLDPAGLESAAGLVSAALSNAPALLIVNKFGKQEIDGRGFRPLIGEALSQGIPVLTAVNAQNLPAFERFADGFGTRLPGEAAAILAWCRAPQ